MRFLVDESAGKRISELLKQAGHDVLFVGDIMRGISDEKILAAANTENRILVTDDKDFGELVFRLSRPTSGVVLFRVKTTDPEQRAGLLLGVVGDYKIEGRFVTIIEGGAKIRKI